MSEAQVNIGSIDGATSPMPCVGLPGELRASAVLTAAWVASNIISVRDARKITLFIAYNAAAAGTANRPQMIFAVSGELTAPAIGTDEWYALGLTDAAPTAAVLTGTGPTGWDATITPEYYNHVVAGASFTLQPSDNGTDKIRCTLTLDVTGAKHFVMLAKELGDTDADQLGTLGVRYTLSL